MVKTRTRAEGFTDAIRARIWEVDKDQPVVDVASYDTLIGRYNGIAHFLTFLHVAFAVLALALACSGIYSVVSYSVTQRRAEIGIRTALGARSADVVWLVLSQVASPVLAATVIGLTLATLLATYAGKSIPLFLFQISATDVLTYTSVTFLLMIIAGLAAYLPARRAAAVDPVDVLRQDA